MTASPLLAGMKALILTVFTFGMAIAGEPIRDKGLSVHMLPDRVAKLGGKQGGFSVNRQQKTLPAATALIEHFKKQPSSVQDNGIWIVTTNPISYSDAEKAKLEELVKLCERDKIPVFVCRSSELPDGWKRRN